MQDIFLDIETIPTQAPDAVAIAASQVTPPANYKDPDKIAAYVEEKAQAIVGKTSFDGLAGHAVCIGFKMIGARQVQCLSAKTLDEEAEMIDRFFRLLGITYPTRFIGHNVGGFDIPFLTMRALVLGVKLPPVHVWPRSVKPWDDKRVFDTMTVLPGRDMVSLDRLCRALGIPGKGDITGADVYPLWLEGAHGAIADYCGDDVRRVEAVFNRFIAINWEGFV